MIGFTPAQAIAVKEHKKNIIVSAGAGSGKTHVLVERFLALLEDNPTWHLNNIVAITFTRKAADEMRDRVRQKLESRYHQAIADNKPDMADRWASWLGEIDGAQIDTIHGLCANLLRANFAEAELDPEFEVLDEIQASLLLDSAIQKALVALKAEHPPAPELDLFALYGENRVLGIIHNPSLLAMTLQPINDNERIIHQWIDIHSAHFLDQADKLDVHHEYSDDERWDLLMTVIDTLKNGADYDEKVRQLNDLASLNFTKNRIADPTIKSILMTMRDSAKDFRDDWQKLQDSLEHDDMAQEIQILWLNLIGRIKKAYELLKTDLAVLDFDDLETRTHALLQNPDIINRYRHKEIMHLMVDEFQDTNMTQWGIIEAIGGGDTTHITFLVGDDKQSIYGFRGGDVSVFNRVKSKIIGAQGENPALNKSFRTQSSLITWFNRFFSQVLTVNPYMPAFIRDFQVGYGDDMEANRQSQYDHLPVRMLLINDHTVDEAETKLSSDERREWEAMAIADEIQEIIAQKLPVWDKEAKIYRPVQYRDIAILYRSMTHINTYEDALRMFGVPFITVAGKGYYNRQEVWDLINLLQAVYNPYDDLALVSALRSPLFHISDDALLMMRLFADNQQISFWDAVLRHTDITDMPPADATRLTKANILINELRGQIGRRTLGDVLRFAVYETGYLGVMSSLPDGDRRRGNIEKLIEKASTATSLSLGEFVTYWRNLNDKEVREGDAPLEVGNAVTLMTIHASKGLEYPVVFIPNAQSGDRGDYAPVIYEAGGTFGSKLMVDGEAFNTLGYQWVSLLNKERDKTEALRLLYVATTRAGDYLYLSGQANLSRAKTKTPDVLIHGWLKMIVDALNLTNTIQSAFIAHTPSVMVDDTHIMIPQNRPTPTRQNIQRADLWDTDMSKLSPAPLPLLDDVIIEQTAPAKHLSATTLADLGGAEHANQHRDIFAQRFRQRVFHDAPNRIHPISIESERTRSRKIGEVVHEALRHWHLPSTTQDENLRLILEN
ncbi:MAG: UvrD-helicase domain-containing protein, partial [Anaerolineae bacterium]|nr:UvrD-helicase domain-containing protein [Anaerolineae bacterium]